MDMIYFEKPLFILLPLILSLWQIAVYLLKKKASLTPFKSIILDGIGAIGHAVAITIILMNDGTLSDALLLVLLSGTLALFLSPKAGENKKQREENK